MADQPSSNLELELDVQVPDEFADKVDVSLLRKIIERVLTNEGIHGKAEISLVITNDETIRELNRTYRGIDRPTDVLSFPLQQKPRKRGARFVFPSEDVIHFGDIVISFPRAVEQAKEYGHSLEREMGYLTAHGVLHLLGYDHKTKAEREQMRAKEESALVDLPR